MTIVSLDQASWQIEGASILRDVTLAIRQNEDIALIGPSGSGKTTLLTLLAGLISPSSGHVHVSPDSARPGARPIVWQAFELFSHLTVLENVAFGSARRDAIEEWVDAALSAARISDKRHRFPAQLSGGEQQRTAIARALRPGVSLMLLDEPFANLDPSLRREVAKQIFFRQITKAASIVLCSHDPKEISAYCKRIICIEAGSLTFDGPIEELQVSPSTRFQAEFFGGFNIVSGLVKTLEPDSAQIILEGDINGSTSITARRRAPERLGLPAIGAEGNLAIPSTAFTYGAVAANVLEGLELIRTNMKGGYRSDLLRLPSGDTIVIEGSAAMLGEIRREISWSPADTTLLAA